MSDDNDSVAFLSHAAQLNPDAVANNLLTLSVGKAKYLTSMSAMVGHGIIVQQYEAIKKLDAWLRELERDAERDAEHYAKAPSSYAEFRDRYIPESYIESEPKDVFVPDKDYVHSDEPTTIVHDTKVFETDTSWLADISKRLWEDVLPKDPTEEK